MCKTVYQPPAPSPANQSTGQSFTILVDQGFLWMTTALIFTYPQKFQPTSIVLHHTTTHKDINYSERLCSQLFLGNSLLFDPSLVLTEMIDNFKLQFVAAQSITMLSWAETAVCFIQAKKTTTSSQVSGVKAYHTNRIDVLHLAATRKEKVSAFSPRAFFVFSFLYLCCTVP